MLKEQDGKGDEENYEKIQERKADELATRRAALFKRCEKKQTLRRAHIARRESLEAEKLRRSQETTDQKLREVQRTHRLAEELSRRKNLEIQKSLQSSKVKSRPLPGCVLTENQSQSIHQKVKKEAQEAKLLRECSQKDDSEMTRLKELEEKKRIYRRDLQNQLIDNRRRLREKEEERHRERKVLEEVGEVIRKEELETEKRKKEIASLMQTEKEAFLQARQFWKDKRKDVLRKEHEEIARVIAEKEAKDKEEAEEKSDSRAVQDALLEKLSKKIMDEEHKRQEREEICRELYVAERENERANEIVRSASKRRRAAKELLQDMVSQRKAAAERKAKEDTIDAAFARYLAEERRISEEKEKQKEQKRREKTMQLGNELRETIMKNRNRYEMEILRKRQGADRNVENVEERDSKQADICCSRISSSAKTERTAKALNSENRMNTCRSQMNLGDVKS